MSDIQEVQNSLFKAIDEIVSRRTSQLDLDKTIVATIYSNRGKIGDRTLYKVEYNGGYFNAKTAAGDSYYLPGMSVLVQIPQGDFSKEKTIIGLASKMASDANISAVSSALNNYSIVGSDIINDTEEYGLRSYHNARDSSDNNNEHQVLSLFNTSQTNNKIQVKTTEAQAYRTDATALMIRAEFLTKLDSTQRQSSSGEYGLAFNLKFKNQDFEDGATQGEVLNKLTSDFYIPLDKEDLDERAIDDIENFLDYYKEDYCESLKVIDDIINNSTTTSEINQKKIERINLINRYVRYYNNFFGIKHSIKYEPVNIPELTDDNEEERNAALIEVMNNIQPDASAILGKSELYYSKDKKVEKIDRPDTITVYLLEKSYDEDATIKYIEKARQDITINEDNKWEWDFKDVPCTDVWRDPIQYYIGEEVGLGEYNILQPCPEISKVNGVYPETREITGFKEWDSNERFYLKFDGQMNILIRDILDVQLNEDPEEKVHGISFTDVSTMGSEQSIADTYYMKMEDFINALISLEDRSEYYPNFYIKDYWFGYDIDEEIKKKITLNLYDEYKEKVQAIEAAGDDVEAKNIAIADEASWLQEKSIYYDNISIDNVEKYFIKYQTEKEYEEEAIKLNFETIKRAIENLIYPKDTIEKEWDIKVDLLKTDLINLRTKFSQEFADKYTSKLESVSGSYLTLINNLLEAWTYSKNITTIQNIYNSWMNESTGEEEFKTISYVLSSYDMIGNPFSFSSWSSQYALFEVDLNNFEGIESIIFYHTGFENSYAKEKITPPNPYQSDSEEAKNYIGEPDILVKDIQLYFLKELSEANGQYSLKTEAPTTGFTFQEKGDNNLKINAAFARNIFEDLTLNENTRKYWFKEDMRIIGPKSADYNIYGGIGWRLIDDTNSKYLTLRQIDNPAYETKYRCVVVYTGEDPQIILRYDFSVYNPESKSRIRLQSNLGTTFSFDSGQPIIKVEIGSVGGQEEEWEEQTNDNYKYTWFIKDSTGKNATIPLEEVENKFNLTKDEILEQQQFTTWLKNVQYYNGTQLIGSSMYDRITRIKYPARNMGAAKTVTFVCHGQYFEEGTSEWKDLGSAEIVFTNQTKDANIQDYTIQIENGDQVFKYDEYGKAPDDTSLKTPQIIKPVIAHLLDPQGIEITSSNYSVKWTMPITDTMLTYNTQEAKDDPTSEDNKIFTGTSLSFGIAKTYDESKRNCQILCQVSFGGKTIYQKTNFFFTKVGHNGTNGTDVIAKIIPTSESSVLFDQPFTIYEARYKDEENQLRKKVFLNYQSPSAAIDDLLLTDGNKISSPLITKVYQKGEEIPITDNQILWNISGNTNSTDNLRGKYIIIETDTDNQTNSLRWQTGVEENKDYNIQIIKSQVTLDDKQYYSFFNLPTITYYSNSIPAAPASRIAIKDVDYLKEITYNADGRNPIYNHNQGLKIINLPALSKIIWKAKGGWSSDKKEDSPCFSLLLDKDSQENKTIYEMFSEDIINQKYRDYYYDDDNESKRQIRDVWFEENYKSQGITSYDKEAKIYILPNDAYNGGTTNNYIEVLIQVPEDKTLTNWKDYAKVIAPIYMCLNTFGLASLNAWDGNKVDVNEEGGYIMAPQIGAGEKDENNRFTGVLMGSTETYTGGDEGTEHQTGLFGYSHGVQSIFLDSKTGNAFFGLPDGYTFKEESGIPVPVTEKDNEADTYGEGRVELRPGDVSKVGGWRMGRKSLYYMTKEEITQEKNEETGEIEDVSNWVYTNDEIGKSYYEVSKDPFSKHHIKDIQPEYQGILLSADPSYISIKGKILRDLPEKEVNQVTGEETVPRVANGNAIEIQLDPSNVTAFGIFRHYQETDYETQETSWKKVLMSGLNRNGRLVANAVKDASTTGSTIAQTSLGIHPLNAFGEVKIKRNQYGNPVTENNEIVKELVQNYLGLVLEGGNGEDINEDDKNLVPFMRFFVNTAKIADPNSPELHFETTAHIDGGGAGNSYQRPIHIHGKEISLYVANDPPKYSWTDELDESTYNYNEIYTPNDHITISTDKAEIKNSKGFFKIERIPPVGSNHEILSTELNVDTPITITNKGSYAFNLTTGNQTINSGTVSWTAGTGKIDINSSNILLNHNNDNSILDLNSDYTKLSYGANTSLLLNNIDTTWKTGNYVICLGTTLTDTENKSYLYMDSTTTKLSSNNKCFIQLNNGTGTGDGNIIFSHYSNTNDTYMHSDYWNMNRSVLANGIKLTGTYVENGTSSGCSILTTGGTTYLDGRTNTRGNSSGNDEYQNYYLYVNGISKFTKKLTVSSGGINITGSSTFDNNVKVSSEGIKVTGDSTFDNKVTANSFSGDGTNVTNTASGSSVSSSSSTLSNNNLRITVPSVSLGNNNRPNFSSTSLDIDIDSWIYTYLTNKLGWNGTSTLGSAAYKSSSDFAGATHSHSEYAASDHTHTFYYDTDSSITVSVDGKSGHVDGTVVTHVGSTGEHSVSI